jgi:hypothetical protein
MSIQQLRETILNELPTLMQNDTAFREVVIQMTRFQFADKMETESRFEHVMARLDRMMEQDSKKLERLDRIIDEERNIRLENQRKWAENERKWAENERKWTENQKQIVALNTAIQNLELRLDRKMEEDRKMWAANQQKWDVQQEENRKMRAESEQKWEAQREENRKMWAESEQKWEAQREENRKMWAAQREQDDKKWEKFEQKWAAQREEDDKKWTARREEDNNKWAAQREEDHKMWADQKKATDDLNRKSNQWLGAVGRRWGLHSEASFRNALAGILKDFQIEVLNVTEWDENGVVFGRPDQVELDIIIQNGLLIACEIKSSVSKSDMHVFDKKVRFYEQKQARQANRMIVISPMVDDNALPLAKKLGIEVYSYAEDVNL